MANDLRDKGIQSAEQAVEADTAQRYEEAIKGYIKAAEYLLTATKYEKNPVTLTTLRTKCVEYTTRAEFLRKGVDSGGKNGKNGKGGKAVCGRGPLCALFTVLCAFFLQPLLVLAASLASRPCVPGLHPPFCSNVWKWKTQEGDIPIPWQETYNLSAPVPVGPNPANSLYFSCNNSHVQFGTADGLTFVKYTDGDTVTLLDQQLFNQGVCMLRTYSHPIDLMKTTRIELNVKTAGRGAPCVNDPVAGRSTCAPWFAVWLAPMIYEYGKGYENTWNAEINLIENHAGAGGPGTGGPYGFVYNNVHSSFPGCDNVGCDNVACDTNVPKELCQKELWDVDATDINHHITVKVVDDGSGVRTLKIWHCKNEVPSTPLRTCSGSVFAHMSLRGKDLSDPSKFWSPVWEKSVADKFYGKYQLVTNMWDTHGTGLEFSTSDVELYQ